MHLIIYIKMLFMISMRLYIFWHQGAILMESSRTKEYKSNTLI